LESNVISLLSFCVELRIKSFFFRPVIIEVPHFGSLRGMEREIVILRSENGETWREHTLEASEEAVHEVLNESFEGEGE
jgi:ankyrin